MKLRQYDKYEASARTKIFLAGGVFLIFAGGLAPGIRLEWHIYLVAGLAAAGAMCLTRAMQMR